MIKMFCGRPGSGKSYLASNLAIKDMKRGRPVFSNYPITFHSGRYEYRSLILTRDMIRNGTYPPGSLIIVDECNHWFNSRNFKEFNVQDLIFFTQHRHIGLDMFLISQHPQRVDVSIREIVNTYYEIINIGPLSLIFKYDNIEDYSTGKQFPQIIWRMPQVFTAYNTNYFADSFDNREEKYDIWETPVQDYTWDYVKTRYKEKLLDLTKGKYRRRNTLLHMTEQEIIDFHTTKFGKIISYFQIGNSDQYKNTIGVFSRNEERAQEEERRKQEESEKDTNVDISTEPLPDCP